MTEGTPFMIEKVKVLDAGNVHARRPVVEMRLAASARTTLAPAATRRLLASLPAMREEVLDLPAWRRVALAETDVPAAALIELLAVVVQRCMNWPIRFCSWRAGEGDGTHAVFEIGTRRVGLRAGRFAAELLEAFIEEKPGLDALFRERMISFSKAVARETPSYDAMTVARVAAGRGIPWATLPGSIYLRLGWGRHARVLRGSETTSTSSIASKLAHRKRLASPLLKAAGLPMASQKTVRRIEDAQAAARSIGFPVVIKPARGNMGRGVSVGVAEAGVAAAFERAQAVSRDVLVEALIAGEEYRLLVVDRRFVAAARRRPAQIRGDGLRTVRELIARENARPEREAILPGQMAALLPIELDAEAIALLGEQGLVADAVPGAGEVVLLRRESNVSRGGDSVDETARVHPSIRAVAERAATVLGIDVCGVDFIASDIERPWRETGAAICEVNTRPGLVLHSRVAEGTRREVERDVVRMLFPKGAPARPPVVAMLEGEGTAPLIDALTAAAARAGRRLGVARRPESHGVLGDEVHRLDGIAAVAWDAVIDAAVVEASAKEVVRRGLGLERIDLAILPQGDLSPTVSRAGAALGRVAGNRVVSARDPEALAKALDALGFAKRGTETRQAPSAAVRPSRAPTGRRREDRFSVLMVGDVGFGESYLHYPRAAPLHHLLRTHGHRHCFARLDGLLGSADMVIGNLEAPLSERPDPSLKGRKKYLGWSDAEPAAQALKEAGFDAVSLANNHSLDCGTAGLMETIERLEARGIASFGAGGDLGAADRPLVASFSLAGVERSLVVFAGFEHRPRYERRYRWYARPGAAGVGALSAARIGASIRALRDKLPSPIFVAYPHWGTDYRGVTDDQRTRAAELVEAGVDLVIGHGSHTGQAVEMVGGRPVVFGLGNFVWNTPGRYAKLDVRPYGVAAVLEFRADRPHGIDLRLYPLLTDNTVTGFRNRPVVEAEFAEAAHALTVDLMPKPRMGADAVGHHIEMELIPAVRGDPKRPGDGAATARARPPAADAAAHRDPPSSAEPLQALERAR